MPDDERSYFQARAEEEIEAARAASHSEAVRAHYLLAGYYLDLVHNPAAARSNLAADVEHARAVGAAGDGAMVAA